MAWVGAAVGLGTSIYSAVQQKKAAKQMQAAGEQAGDLYELRAQGFEQQAIDLERKKQLLGIQKGLTEFRYNRVKGQVMGQVITRTAKSGLMMSGSPLAVLSDNLKNLEMDSRIEQLNIDQEVFNVEAEQRQLALEAVESRRGGDVSRAEGKARAQAAKIESYANYGKALSSATSMFSSMGSGASSTKSVASSSGSSGYNWSGAFSQAGFSNLK